MGEKKKKKRLKGAQKNPHKVIFFAISWPDTSGKKIFLFLLPINPHLLFGV
jgi:hypothetical protein